MNNRIDKLAEKAGAKVHKEQTRSGDWGDFSNYDGFDHDKFAELIIQECVNISNQAENQCQHPGTAIKKHFGVE